MELHHAIIHRLLRVDTQPSQIDKAPASLDVTDEALRNLVAEVHQVYGERAGKRYSNFDPGLAQFSAEQYLHRLRDEANPNPDFYDISLKIMVALKHHSDKQNFATGGYVLMFDYSDHGRRWFVIAVVNSSNGTMVDEHFHVVAAPHLDTEGLRFAGRVNFSDWGEGSQRCVSFLRGKKAEVSKYFQEFMGCSDVQNDLADTKHLVAAIKQFSTAQGLDEVRKEQLLSAVNQHARAKEEVKEPLELDVLANMVWPEDPAVLKAALAASDPPISDGFVPQKRGLYGLVRFKAKTPNWTLEFEREAIKDQTITFDAEAKTVTIQNLPPDLLEKLNEEFATHAPNTDDSAN